MPDLTFILDATTGAVLVEDSAHLPAGAADHLTEFFGPARALACAMPLALLHLPAASPSEIAADRCVRISGVVHDSLIEGPGRRSTAKLQGCAIRCEGCITRDSWDPTGGYLVPVDRLADALLDPAHDRDGVSILGGEPFQQPDGLLALVRALRARGCRHVLVYSGYTYERLRRMAQRQPAIGAVLDEIEVLVDGPYVAALADGAGPWTGSGNQRVIEVGATRHTGRVILLEAPLQAACADDLEQTASDGDDGRPWTWTRRPRADAALDEPGSEPPMRGPVAGGRLARR